MNIGRIQIKLRKFQGVLSFFPGDITTDITLGWEEKFMKVYTLKKSNILDHWVVDYWYTVPDKQVTEICCAEHNGRYCSLPLAHAGKHISIKEIRN
jgi:hypothetical protein